MPPKLAAYGGMITTIIISILPTKNMTAHVFLWLTCLSRVHSFLKRFVIKRDLSKIYFFHSDVCVYGIVPDELMAGELPFVP